MILEYYRSYGTPPSMVMHVMSSVCVLLQQPTDWDTVKHLMSDPIVFLKTLTTFDKDNVPDKVIKIVGLFNHLQVSFVMHKRNIILHPRECIKQIQSYYVHLNRTFGVLLLCKYVACYLALQYRLSNHRRNSSY